MQNGTCPTCGGTEVYAARNGLGIGESSDKVAIRPHMEPGFRGMVQRHVSDGVWSYTCASCGLTEIRVHDPAAIDFIRQRWIRVQPSA
jgi:predicted nucleic-acid-binding Zn-ribbon protein